MHTSPAPVRVSTVPIRSALTRVLAAAGLLALIATKAPAADVSWAMAVGGTWDDGTKWVGGVPPDSGDAALVTVPPEPGGYGVVVDDADVEVDRLVLGASGIGAGFTVHAVTVHTTGPGTSVLDSGASIGLSNGALFRLGGPTEVVSDFIFDGGVGGGGSWSNEGTLDLDGGADAIYGLDEVFDNSGSLTVSSGRLLVSDAFTTSGSVTVTAGAELEFDVPSTIHTLAEGATFTGAGTIGVLGVILDVTATTPVSVGAGLTVDLGGELRGASVTLDGTLIWSGDVTGSGELLNRGLVQVDGDLWAKTLANESTVEVTSLRLFDGALVENRSDGVLDLVDGSSVTVSTGGGMVTSSGAVRKASGAGTATFSAALTTSGTVDVDAGTLSVDDFRQTGGVTTVGGTLSSSSALDITGGLLQGTGTVNADVDLGGVLEAGDGGRGHLDVTGVLTVLAAGRLRAELGGLVPGTEYDQVTASAAASLDGTLELVLVDGFVPGLGDSFTVVDAATTGDFTTLDLPALPPGRAWEVTTDPVVVTVVEGLTEAVFEDGFESGDTSSWSAGTGETVTLEAGPLDAVAVVWRSEARRIPARPVVVLTAIGKGGSEIHALEARQRWGEVEIRLHGEDPDRRTPWIGGLGRPGRSGRRLELEHHPSFAALADGTVFLDLGGELRGWLTELTGESPVDQIRYDRRFVARVER